MSDATPKHRQIFNTLCAQIRDGRFASRKRFPSENELAARFGVSRPTAARALRDLGQLGLLVRKAGSGTYLSPPPESPAKATWYPDLPRETSRHKATIQGSDNGNARPCTFGLLVPGLGNTEILDPICSEISRRADPPHVTIVTGGVSSDVITSDEVERLCRRYIDRKVDGVFFAPVETVPDREQINRRIAGSLRDAGIPVVLLDRDILEYPARSDFDLVAIDNFHAGHILAAHLLKLGHRKLCFVARPQFPSTTDLRLAGCREAIARYGDPAARIVMQNGDPQDKQFVQSLVERLNPDVFVCSNDRTAALLSQTLSALGLRIPADVALAGFDDVRYASLLNPPLTTVRQPCTTIAEVAFSSMWQRHANPMLPPRQILLPVELVVRESCGSP